MIKNLFYISVADPGEWWSEGWNPSFLGQSMHLNGNIELVPPFLAGLGPTFINSWISPCILSTKFNNMRKKYLSDSTVEFHNSDMESDKEFLDSSSALGSYASLLFFINLWKDIYRKNLKFEEKGQTIKSSCRLNLAIFGLIHVDNQTHKSLVFFLKKNICFL